MNCAQRHLCCAYIFDLWVRVRSTLCGADCTAQCGFSWSLVVILLGISLMQFVLCEVPALSVLKWELCTKFFFIHYRISRVCAIFFWQIYNLYIFTIDDVIIFMWADYFSKIILRSKDRNYNFMKRKDKFLNFSRKNCKKYFFLSIRYLKVNDSSR